MLSHTTGTSKQDENNTSGNSQVSLPSLSLPKGGGAIRGIGEKFAANPVTGTGSLTVPITTSPGRSGFGPQLALSYDSGAGSGPFGFGWSLSLPSISRKTDKGLPQYTDAEESDIFILSGAEDLVALLGENNGQWKRDESLRTVYGKQYSIHRYRPRVEGLFARIERWVNLSDLQDTFWRSISKDNITTWYGKTGESRIADPADPTRVFSWLICESYDDKGNVIVYRYKPENSDGIDLSQAHERNRFNTSRSANRYLKHVFYGNRTPYFPNLTADAPVQLPTDWYFELVFDYGEHDLNAPVPQEGGRPWDCRADPFSAYRATFEVRTYRLCRRALMFHHIPDGPDDQKGYDGLVRSTNFTDAQPSQPSLDLTRPFYSFLLSVTQTGYRRNADGSYLSKALPPLEFAYSEAVINETVLEIDAQSLENLPCGLDGSRYQWVDLDGEGLSGILTEQADNWFYKPNLSPVNQHSENGAQSTLAQFGPAETVTRKPSLAALQSGRQQLLDLAGDGHLDLVQFDGPAPGFFERTEEESWAPFTPFTSLPELDWQNPNLKFVDVTGDGHADLLISEDDAFWWHISLAAAGFGPAQRVQQALDEEKGPKLIFADGTDSIFLADVSGDGLTDLVRIRNGEVCYWPNLGYGHFGAKVTMDQAPWFEAPDVFDGSRIRLADIDGSGTADILYFASGGVHLYFNQSGNAWGERHILSQFPPVESISSATVLDLLGNGTACLVWSSPLPGNMRQPMRYIDLMGGQKPHLLTRVTNNLGAETHVQYAPSTKFYVADKLAGTPWLTRIPFPVHVIERVDTYDYVSRNRFVTRYAYHHGFYDGVEREFRGFGRVDQWDTEEFATLTSSSTFPQASNIDASSHVPPGCTRTWFHTGAFFGEASVSKHFEQEYYREGSPGDAVGGLTDAQLETMLLDDTVLPTTILLPDGSRMPYNLSAEEAREACRALRGSILRQEIYALDDTDASDRPYSLSERNYTIEVLQPQGTNKYAVFFTHPRETIDFHYERKLFKVVGNTMTDPNVPLPNARNAADPRVTHAITLAVDTFGNVLQSVAVGYGRRYLDPSLTSADQTRQGTTLSTYTENSYTNAIFENDAYRAPLPAESRTYELIQVKSDATHVDVTNLFRFDEMQAKVQAASDGQHDIPYENLAATGVQAGHPYRRLIEQTRTLYRPNDMGATAGDPKTLLPLRKLESLALPGSSYKLAFTPGLLSKVYQRGQAVLLPNPTKVLGSVGADGGGYVDLDGDGNWWIPSGRMFYSPDPAATPQQELAQAQAHFFLARRYRNPFHTDAMSTEAFVSYDAYDLLMQETQDALGNRVTVGERSLDPTQPLVRSRQDYRVLQPTLVMDPNRNRSAVAFDALGMVVGTAVMGKPEDNPRQGDLLNGFDPDLTDAAISAHLQDPLADPYSILKQATTRLIYDLSAYYCTKGQTNPQPAIVYTLVRETHDADLTSGQQTKVQHSFSYSDGFGREIQKKIQAEPGSVPQRDPATGRVIVVNGQPQMTPNNVSPRWVGSGWMVFNNKGKPVRQYEPFFTDTHRFEFDIRIGVSLVLCYDPVERVVTTLHPNHTYEKVVFDAWRQETWDVNDTVLVTDPKSDPDVGDFFQRLPDTNYLPTWQTQRQGGALGSQEQDAASKAAIHANTPTVAHFDTLGRPFLTVAHNKFKRTDTPPTDPPIEEFCPTRTILDIEGNQREVLDAKNRLVMRYDYDILSNRIHQASMEAGERWMLNDVVGKPLYAWDSRGHQIRSAYDQLRRPTDVYLREGTGPELLVGRTIYGETRPNPEASNLRGKVVQLFDQAGVVTSDKYDFKGNLLHSQRQLAQEYKTTLNWSVAVPLDAASYTGSTRYDALNRPIEQTAPDNSIIRNVYNEANLLERVEANLRAAAVATPFVTNIDYDAKRQRTRIDYGTRDGKGISTTYAYDPETFRLVQLKTSRNSTDFNGTDRPGEVQNLYYTYDPTGNITYIRDDAQDTIYFRNRLVEPGNGYTYDAIYRLIEATGREHLGQTNSQPNPPTPADAFNSFHTHLDHPGDANALGTYIERYLYDSVGNILAMQHRGSDPQNLGWTRTYTYNETSQLEVGKVNNRLTSTTLGANIEVYRYDGSAGLHGNITAMPHLPQMQWDYRDQLQATVKQVVSSGSIPETTYYVYDANGQRVRKVTERQATAGQTPTRLKERIYLGGFETYREYNGGGNTIALERETLHIMDDKQRVALVETRTQGDDGSPAQIVRYQLGNHLGSVALELDDQAQIISYEEYYPYGSTSYQAVRNRTEVAKRYRYTGKERDEESGLYYHGARYYACWLGRWVSCDPVDLLDKVANQISRLDAGDRNGGSSTISNSDGESVESKQTESPTDPRSDPEDIMNLYLYGRSNPITYSDDTGMAVTVRLAHGGDVTAVEEHNYVQLLRDDIKALTGGIGGIGGIETDFDAATGTLQIGDQDANGVIDAADIAAARATIATFQATAATADRCGPAPNACLTGATDLYRELVESLLPAAEPDARRLEIALSHSDVTFTPGDPNSFGYAYIRHRNLVTDRNAVVVIDPRDYDAASRYRPSHRGGPGARFLLNPNVHRVMGPLFLALHEREHNVRGTRDPVGAAGNNTAGRNERRVNYLRHALGLPQREAYIAEPEGRDRARTAFEGGWVKHPRFWLP